MQQLLSLWSALSVPRRAVIVGATVAVFAAILMMGRVAMQPGMALLYAGLEGAAAGQVVEGLERRGIAYDVRGDAIYVPQSMRDEIRMSLAGEGLPASGAAGYEILDNLSGFGTTSQMFDAAYLRAKEGELARTILASPSIRAARVHIAQPVQQPFRREVAPTAAVTITPMAGPLPPGQARALRYLVASAVAGLRPEDVSIIDSVGGTVLASDEAGAADDKAERESALRRAVERLLAAHVGPGRALVEVSVETVTETETIVERRLDPEARVAVTSDSEERSSTSSDAQPAGVTVASNLPDGDASTDGGRSQSQETELRERLTFDVSEIQRELLRVPGEIRRLTVAVLVDGVSEPDETGALQWRPRAEADLDSLRELVAAAVGFNDARGDVITMKSLRFEPVEPLAHATEAGLIERLNLDAMKLLQLAVMGIVSLALIFFVIRPLLRTMQAAPAGRAGAGLELGPPASSGQATLALDDQFPAAAPMPLNALPAIADIAFPVALGDRAGGGSGGEEDAVARLRRLIEERQEETVEILRGWMEDDEEERA